MTNEIGKITAEEVQKWRATRKEAGLNIDPETAEVVRITTQTLDPYGVYRDLPEEFQQIGKEDFARSPESDVWVWFGDLPEATRDALWKRYSKKSPDPVDLPWDSAPE
jgi:hypothetical protein